jgi:hypothetical protein
MVGVFPEPLGPRKPKTPPEGISRLSPATAIVEPPRSLRNSLAESMDLDYGPVPNPSGLPDPPQEAGHGGSAVLVLLSPSDSI